MTMSNKNLFGKTTNTKIERVVLNNYLVNVENLRKIKIIA